MSNERDRGLVEHKSLGVEAAIKLRDKFLEDIPNHFVGEATGFVVVTSRDGTLLCAQAVGDNVKQYHIDMALSKAQTVNAVKRSSSVQRERMAESGATNEDYGNRLGSLLNGGLAVFADEDCKIFLGALAFSGGGQGQDEKSCRQAIVESNFYTDTKEEPIML